MKRTQHTDNRLDNRIETSIIGNERELVPGKQRTDS